jgi:hypothetical protein
MATRETTKHTPLKTLLEIQANQYRDTKGRDYDSQTIDQLIIDRFQSRMDREHSRLVREYNDAA